MQEDVACPRRNGWQKRAATTAARSSWFPIPWPIAGHRAFYGQNSAAATTTAPTAPRPAVTPPSIAPDVPAARPNELVDTVNVQASTTIVHASTKPTAAPRVPLRRPRRIRRRRNRPRRPPRFPSAKCSRVWTTARSCFRAQRRIRFSSAGETAHCGRTVGNYSARRGQDFRTGGEDIPAEPAGAHLERYKENLWPRVMGDPYAAPFCQLVVVAACSSDRSRRGWFRTFEVKHGHAHQFSLHPLWQAADRRR